MDKEILKQLGFLDAEIEVYLALLRLGPCLVSKVHEETGLHRTHIYDLIEKLREKGLVSTFIQSGKKHVRAAKPSKILAYIEDKKDAVKALVPQLEKLTLDSSEETNIELFKGKEGLKTVLQDVLKTKKDYCVMGNIKQFESVLEFSFPGFLKAMEDGKIKERIICDDKEKILKIKSGSYRRIKTEHLFPSSFWIYGRKVAIFVWHAPYFVIVIDNKNVAATYQNCFDFFWNLGRT